MCVFVASDDVSVVTFRTIMSNELKATFFYCFLLSFSLNAMVPVFKIFP